MVPYKIFFHELDLECTKSILRFCDFADFCVVFMFLDSTRMRKVRPVVRLYVLFLYPLKISENQRFSDIFSGYRKRLSWTKWITSVPRLFLEFYKEYLEEGTQVSSFFWRYFRNVSNNSRPRRSLSILGIGIRAKKKKDNCFKAKYDKNIKGTL